MSRSGNAVWINDGSGIFARQGRFLPDEICNGVDAGDLDNDGDPNICISSREPDAIWLNNQ